jgi:hypothetical protein
MQIAQQELQLKQQKMAIDAAALSDKQELEQEKVSGELELEALRVGAQIQESKAKADAAERQAGLKIGVDVAKSQADQRLRAAQLLAQSQKPSGKSDQ